MKALRETVAACSVRGHFCHPLADQCARITPTQFYQAADTFVSMITARCSVSVFTHWVQLRQRWPQTSPDATSEKKERGGGQLLCSLCNQSPLVGSRTPSAGHTKGPPGESPLPSLSTHVTLLHANSWKCEPLLDMFNGCWWENNVNTTVYLWTLMFCSFTLLKWKKTKYILHLFRFL